MSDTKLVDQPPKRHGIVLAPDGAAHLARQLATSCAVAFAALALLLCSSKLAGATSQDDGSGKSAAKGSDGSDAKKDGDAKDAEKESKGKPKKSDDSADVKRLEDMSLPPNVLLEVKRGERSQRTRVPELDIVNPLPPGDQKISAAEKKKFDEIKKQDLKKDDAPFLDDYIKRQVYSMTYPGWLWGDGRKYREEIEQILVSANPANINDRFFVAYKGYLKQYLQDLLDNHLWTRVNAMRLLDLTKDEDTIPILCGQIRDPKQHEAVKFVAIEGIELLGKKKLKDVGLESDAVGTLLDLLAQTNIQQKTRMAAVRALGAIGRPGRDIGLKRDVKVAIVLLNIMRDPNIRRWDRHEALVALAGLSIPPDLDYNFQFVAHEIAMFAAEAAQTAVKDPAIDDLHTDMILVAASYALTEAKKPNVPLAERATTKMHPIAAGHRDDVYIRQLGDPLKYLTMSSLKIYIPGTKRPDDVTQAIARVAIGIKDPANRFIPRLEALQDVLKSNEPRSKKLTPDTDELGPPPALVGPKAPAKDAKEGDETKEKVGPDAAENGRTGP